MEIASAEAATLTVTTENCGDRAVQVGGGEGCYREQRPTVVLSNGTALALEGREGFAETAFPLPAEGVCYATSLPVTHLLAGERNVTSVAWNGTILGMRCDGEPALVGRGCPHFVRGRGQYGAVAYRWSEGSTFESNALTIALTSP